MGPGIRGGPLSRNSRIMVQSRRGFPFCSGDPRVSQQTLVLSCSRNARPIKDMSVTANLVSIKRARRFREEGHESVSSMLKFGAHPVVELGRKGGKFEERTRVY
jgi:hypothetical protein